MCTTQSGIIIAVKASSLSILSLWPCPELHAKATTGALYTEYTDVFVYFYDLRVKSYEPLIVNSSGLENCEKENIKN